MLAEHLARHSDPQYLGVTGALRAFYSIGAQEALEMFADNASTTIDIHASQDLMGLTSHAANVLRTLNRLGANRQMAVLTDRIIADADRIAALAFPGKVVVVADLLETLHQLGLRTAVDKVGKA